MPLITIKTNVSKDGIPSNFTENLPKELAEIYGKAVYAFTIVLHPGMDLYRFGSNEPCLTVTVDDIQHHDEDEVRRLSADTLSKILNHINVPKERATLTLNHVPSTTIGFANGMTLADKMKEKK